jgi:Cysteine rich repeat
MITSTLSRLVGAVLLTAASASSVAAQQPLAEQVLEGCKSELESWCQSVTPGEGRLLACLYAHEDQLSGQCEYALYDAAARLERIINALTFVASECGDDIESQCTEVKAGEGRIIECLNKNAGKLSKPCSQALTDVKLKE